LTGSVRDWRTSLDDTYAVVVVKPEDRVKVIQH